MKIYSTGILLTLLGASIAVYAASSNKSDSNLIIIGTGSIDVSSLHRKNVLTHPEQKNAVKQIYKNAAPNTTLKGKNGPVAVY